MFENDVCFYSSEKTEHSLLWGFFFSPIFFSKGREAALPLFEKACFKCVKLYPIIMPPDKGNANTLCIKGAWNIKQPIS